MKCFGEQFSQLCDVFLSFLALFLCGDCGGPIMYQIYCVKNYELVCQTYIIFKVVQSMSKTRIRF